MSDVQLIKDKLDIVDFINEYVQLKPAGVNHKGLCPFHHEKTPSFMASRERQSWHCFGCGKGGDIFSFIQEIEGMEFVEALRYLANKAGVVLSNTRANEIQTSQKNRLKDINTEAARFFHKFLLQMPASKNAMEYLKSRGLTDNTIEEWQIGFIPEQWDLLTQYLLKKGFAIDDLAASGLTIKKDREQQSNYNTRQGFYDRFRGRIMFPIWDIHDNVVGFTGRVLVETEHSGGKYVNTPQTVLYDKSRVVFGLNKAKKEIKAKDLIVMVEGQMDVIACHQAGMENVAATSGTAMTEMQVQILKRYSSNMNIAFDADLAGQAAAKRGIDIAREQGMIVKIIKIPDGMGKDPDECLKKNPAVWQKAVLEAQDIMEWYIRKSLSGRNMAMPRDRQDAANEVLAEIARIPFAVEREFWLKEFSSRTGEEISVLRENMLEVKKKQKQPLTQNKPKKTAIVEDPSLPEDKRIKALAQGLLALIIRFPSVLNENRHSALINNERVNTTLLSTPKFGSLYENILRVYNNKAFNLEALRELYDRDETENIIDILLMKGELDFFEINEAEAEKEFNSLIRQIESMSLAKLKKNLQKEIESAARNGDKKKEAELLEEFAKL